MVAAGAQTCAAFHRHLTGGNGTKDRVRRVIETGIPTYLVESEKAEPRRLWEGDGR
jgi:hypothetical protein